MREQHPMRYNRMTEILKVVASVKLSNTFLLKSYFLKVRSFGAAILLPTILNTIQKPLPMLTATYLFNITAVGYAVFALERSYGTCMEYVGQFNIVLYF